MRFAALVAVLAACGGHGNGGRDSGTTDTATSDGPVIDGPLDAPGDGPSDGVSIDAPPDATPTDAAADVRGTVTVHIVDKNATPLAGLHVVFIDTDATVTDAVTDGTGTASALVFPNASVTAVRARDTGDAYSLTTVLALEPGDDITLISAPATSPPSEDPFTSRTVPLPSLDLASAMKSAGNTLFTTRSAHGLAVGDKVIVEGVVPAGYNGTWTVATVPSTTTFTVSYANNTAGVGGTAAKGLPFTVTFPSYSGATSYEVHTPCGPTNVQTSTTATVLLRAGCSTATMDVLVYAKSDSTTELAAITKANVAFSPGGSTTLSGSWTAVSNLSASYTNPTTRVTGLTLARHTPYLRGTPSVFKPASPPATFDIATAFPPAAWMRTTLTCPQGSSADCITSNTGVAQQTLAERVDGTATSYALDIGADLLPWVSASYDPASTTLAVTVTGSGAYDLFEANLDYFRNVTMPSPMQVVYTWRVFGPAAGNVTFPTLPSSLPGDPTVRSTDTQSAYQVYLCESDALNGYRGAVVNPYLALGACESSPVVSKRPAGGTHNRISQWN